ncbi:DUF5753 domain-containing protein [Embleya sp. NPDC055664]
MRGLVGPVACRGEPCPEAVRREVALASQDHPYVAGGEPDGAGDGVDGYAVAVSTGDRELLDLLVQKRIRHWWQEFANDVNANLAEVIALEDDAEEEWEYHPNLIPGLLQTKNYASAIITTGFNAYGVDQVEALVTVREMRQRLLRDEEPLTYHAITTEAALHFDIGGPSVMREQMHHLIAEMALPNVTFQICPFSAGRMAIQAAGFTILKFEDTDDPDAAWMEGVGGMISLDSKRELRLCNRLFSKIAAAALTPDETAALLRERAKSL